MGRSLEVKVPGNQAVKSHLIVMRDLVLRLVLAQEQELFVVYRSETDPKIEVNLYQSQFQMLTHRC